MVCEQLINSNPRISARRGQIVDLNVQFLHNGAPKSPYAIRHIEIYKTQILPHNLVSVIPVSDPGDTDYPSPLCVDEDIVGEYHLPFIIPDEFEVPDVYHDLWYYYADDPCVDTGCDLDSDDSIAKLLKCCHRFWVYPDNWFCDDRLQTIRFGFEPLDQKFHHPEVRPLEVGLMPLPLYDYNFNLVNPIIPFIRPTISIDTRHCELLVDNIPIEIGLRHGSFRSNPWVVKYILDTSKFLKGTYRYWITLNLPNGLTRVSRKFIFTIS